MESVRCPTPTLIDADESPKSAVSPQHPPPVPEEPEKPNERPPSPEPNCAICLEKSQNKSFADSCLHQFCFTCLLEWSKVKPECPLCKQSFKSIIHNVRSNEDYDQYHLQTLRPQDNWVNVLDMTQQQRFRYRSTMDRNRTLQRAFEPLEQTLQRRVEPGDAIPPQRTLRRQRDLAPDEFRANVYRQNRWVVGLSYLELSRDVSPRNFRNHPEEVHRLIPWLNRELQVVTCSPGMATRALDLIVSLLSRHHIRSTEFRQHLEPYLRDHYDHFIHEFYTFARCPCDMIGFDENANYSAWGNYSRQRSAGATASPRRPSPVRGTSWESRSTVASANIKTHIKRIAGETASPRRPSPVRGTSLMKENFVLILCMIFATTICLCFAPLNDKNLQKMIAELNRRAYDSAIAQRKETVNLKDEEDSPSPIKSIKPVEPQWAYLESEGFQTADFIFAKSPEEFFVRRNDFYQCFQNLVREIKKHPKDKPTGFKLEKGSYCLGKFPEDGVWYRTQVIEILEDDKVSLFFVDHGDYASVSMEDVAPITEKILSMLPFQAIECSLAGIKPIDEDIWSEDATDVLYDFTEECTTMFIKVCEVTEKANHTGGKKYSVLFVHAATEEKIIINKLLVERNLAVSVNSELFEKTEELEALEFSDSNHNSDDGDSDFESEPQILKLSELETSQNSEDAAQNESLEEGDSCIGDMGSIEDEDEGYHVVMDDPFETLRLLLGIDKEQPTSVPALPAPPVCETDTVTTSVPAFTTPSVCEADANTTSVPALTTPSVCETDTVTTSVPALPVREADVVTSDDLNVLPPPTRLTKSPEVLWNQDRNIIGMKIKIVGVVNYYLAWNINHIAFYTELENEKYEVKGKLFGPISEIWHSAKGLYVYIKMKKLVRGVAWARLFDSSQRLPWLKVDLDMKEMKTVVKEYASDTTPSKTRTAKNLGNHVIVPELGMLSDDEDKVIHFEDEDDDDDDSPVEIVDYDGPYDPYDPLN